jgi:SNF2 family DNA or RNA helicase
MKELKLRVHQGPAVAHLLRQPHGGLLMDPGTGKTLCVLTGFHELKRRKLVDRMLVVAPRIVAHEVWPAEIVKWKLPYEYIVLHGSNKERLLQTQGERSDIWIINYDGLQWLFDVIEFKWWKRERWWIVFDESTRIKNTGTARFKNLKQYLPLFARRTILTGTPSPNRLQDLFGQVYACDLGERLGRFITQYRRRFFFPMGYDWQIQPDAEDKIYKVLDGLFYRVSDKVLGLKPLERVPVYVTLPDKARKLYDDLASSFVVKIKRGVKIKAVNEAVLGMKLRQVANGRVYDEKGRSVVIHDEKLDALRGLVEELAGNPLLVGFEFSNDGDELAKTFDCPIIQGGTSTRYTKKVLAAFNKGELPVVAVQASSGMYGLNLQEVCHHVAMYGQMWDLEVHLQFYKRVHRSGQKNTVFLHEFIARDTADEDVRVAVLTGKHSKKNAQDMLLEAIRRRCLL